MWSLRARIAGAAVVPILTGVLGMKRIVFAAAVLVVAVVVAASAGARQGALAIVPGTWCGGDRWKLMTLSDKGASAVNWAPEATSIPVISTFAAPKRIVAWRSTSFERQVWRVVVVINRYRRQSNGEIALELYNIETSMTMNAYMPNPRCLSATSRGRAQMVAARSTFLRDCGAATSLWQLLGASAQLGGVGFWNPVTTTLGALGNGAELRPVTYFAPLTGCGHY